MSPRTALTGAGSVPAKACSTDPKGGVTPGNMNSATPPEVAMPAPSAELQKIVTVDSIDVICVFQVGQWPAQYGVQVKVQALPILCCASAARCCSRASASGAPVFFQSTVSALAMLTEAGTAIRAP